MEAHGHAPGTGQQWTRHLLLCNNKAHQSCTPWMNKHSSRQRGTDSKTSGAGAHHPHSKPPEHVRNTSWTTAIVHSFRDCIGLICRRDWGDFASFPTAPTDLSSVVRSSGRRFYQVVLPHWISLSIPATPCAATQGCTFQAEGEQALFATWQRAREHIKRERK